FRPVHPYLARLRETQASLCRLWRGYGCGCGAGVRSRRNEGEPGKTREPKRNSLQKARDPAGPRRGGSETGEDVPLQRIVRSFGKGGKLSRHNSGARVDGGRATERGSC